MAIDTKKRRYIRTKTSRRLRNSILALIGLTLVLLAILGYHTYSIYQEDLPSFDQLHNIEPSLKTKIYDRNGRLLKEFFSENRALTPYRDMPQPLIEMLLATEDREFYDHWGINIRRAAIVAVNNVLQMEISAGASTITQQLSRMLFLNRRQTFERKIKEALTAIKLERTYAKDEILEMYLNQYYFSRGAYGIAAASRLFFDKEPSQLNINECAIIIGLLKGPNINSPLNNPDKSLQARNRVLYSYLTYGGISREEYDSLKSQPLVISPPTEEVGTAPYFTEWVRQHILEKYGEDALYSGGLEVYTSLDASLQPPAEKALEKKITELQNRIETRYDLSNPAYTTYMPDTVDEFGEPIKTYKQVQGALVAIDNSNGDIIALVGGNGWEKTKFNYAVQGMRPPGSAFKPFVYTAAIDNGFRTTEIIDDNPIVLDIPGAKQWRPHNYVSRANHDAGRDPAVTEPGCNSAAAEDQPGRSDILRPQNGDQYAAATGTVAGLRGERSAPGGAGLGVQYVPEPGAAHPLSIYSSDCRSVRPGARRQPDGLQRRSPVGSDGLHHGRLDAVGGRERHRSAIALDGFHPTGRRQDGHVAELLR